MMDTWDLSFVNLITATAIYVCSWIFADAT
jgi:hypothetical protein